MDHFNGDRFLDWLFSDRMERRITRVFILVAVIFFINLVAGVFK